MGTLCHHDIYLKNELKLEISANKKRSGAANFFVNTAETFLQNQTASIIIVGLNVMGKMVEALFQIQRVVNAFMKMRMAFKKYIHLTGPWKVGPRDKYKVFRALKNE